MFCQVKLSREDYLVRAAILRTVQETGQQFRLAVVEQEVAACPHLARHAAQPLRRPVVHQGE